MEKDFFFKLDNLLLNYYFSYKSTYKMPSMRAHTRTHTHTFVTFHSIVLDTCTCHDFIYETFRIILFQWRELRDSLLQEENVQRTYTPSHFMNANRTNGWVNDLFRQLSDFPFGRTRPYVCLAFSICYNDVTWCVYKASCHPKPSPLKWVREGFFFFFEASTNPCHIPVLLHYTFISSNSSVQDIKDVTRSVRISLGIPAQGIMQHRASAPIFTESAPRYIVHGD